MISVLYLHPIAAFGGATKSLAELVAALPPGAVLGHVLAPRGAAAESLAAVGLQVMTTRGLAQWDNTRFGHYRGLRWLILLRELALLPSTLVALRRAARHTRYDLIHCNEVTALLLGILAKRMIGAPLVVHVRSLQRAGHSGWITRWMNGLLARHADAIVAIDQAVQRSLPADLRLDVVHNGMRVPALADPPPSAGPPRPFTIGIIGVLHRSKGLYELIEAMRLLRDQGADIRLVVVGENVRKLTGLRGWLLRKLDFSRDVRAELGQMVHSYGLEGHVEFTGFVRDVPAIYRRIDAVCFPSHLDAPGRPVFEAALYGLPTIVAMRHPTDDVIVHGETGLCIDTPTPDKIASAIATLAQDLPRARAMGARARAMAMARFDSRICAEKMLALYRRVVMAAQSR
jgi:glycosyltransferase involved in cell wall biosynthesis